MLTKPNRLAASSPGSHLSYCPSFRPKPPNLQTSLARHEFRMQEASCDSLKFVHHLRAILFHIRGSPNTHFCHPTLWHRPALSPPKLLEHRLRPHEQHERSTSLLYKRQH